jgi:hypothetical protein
VSGYQMVKAEIRKSLGATGQSRPGPPADPASTGLVLRAFHDSTDADLLRSEIQRLYRQHRKTSDNQRRPTPATLALEAQIRELAARHWLMTRGITISAAPPPLLPEMTAGRPRLTRVW